MYNTQKLHEFEEFIFYWKRHNKYKAKKERQITIKTWKKTDFYNRKQNMAGWGSNDIG